MKTIIAIHRDQPYKFFINLKFWCFFGFKNLKGSGRYKYDICYMDEKGKYELIYRIKTFFQKLKEEGITFYSFKNLDEYYVEKLNGKLFKYKMNENELNEFLEQFRIKKDSILIKGMV